MKQRLSSLWFNSSIAFSLAGIVATTLHELSHLTAGKLLGENATLYSNAVEFGNNVSVQHQIITASTGPIFSLLSGLLIITIAGKWGKGFIRLFWMWLGLMSAQIGAGYFMIAPFARNGDTGKVLALINAPDFVYWLSFVLGIAGTLLLSRKFASSVVSYADGTAKTMRPFGIFSWLTGSFVLLAIYVFAVRNLSDSDQFITLLGVFAAGIFAPMFSFFYKTIKASSKQRLELSIPYVGLGSLVILLVFVIFVLGSGIRL